MINYIIYSGVIYLILTILFIKNKNLFLIVTIFLQNTILLISFKLGLEFAKISNTIIPIYYVILLFFNIKYVNKKYLLVTLGGLFSFCLFILFLVLYNNADAQFLIDIVKHYFWGQLIFLCILTFIDKIDLRKIFNAIVIYLVLILSVALFQFLTNSQLFYYTDLVQSNTYKIDYSRLVTGFYTGPNYLGSIIILFSGYIWMYFYYNKTKFSNLINIILFLFSFVIILFSGVRTSVVAFVIQFILLYIIFFRKQYLKYFIIILVIIIIYGTTLYSISYYFGTNKTEFENSFGRSLTTIFYFSKSENLESSTAGISLRLFDEILKNPIIGTQNKLYWLIKFSYTDAFLMFHLVQFGILGLFFLLFPYFYFIKKISKKYIKTFYVFFFIQIIIMITDQGLYYFNVNIMFWILMALSVKIDKIHLKDLK